MKRADGGFEDREDHQAPITLRPGSLFRKRDGAKSKIYAQPTTRSKLLAAARRAALKPNSAYCFPIPMYGPARKASSTQRIFQTIKRNRRALPHAHERQLATAIA